MWSYVGPLLGLRLVQVELAAHTHTAGCAASRASCCVHVLLLRAALALALGRYDGRSRVQQNNEQRHVPPVCSSAVVVV